MISKKNVKCTLTAQSGPVTLHKLQPWEPVAHPEDAAHPGTVYTLAHVGLEQHPGAAGNL